jgi:hypothetical protein
MNLQARQAFLALSLRRVKPGSGSVVQFLKTRTWRNPVTDLRLWIDVPYVIVGGVATRLYMPERMTDDLDILIHVDLVESLSAALSRQQAKFLGNLSIDGFTWELSDGTVLDVLYGSQPWIAEALLSPRTSPDGQPVIDLPYLVLMKLAASRTTDLSDISRMLGQATDSDLTRVRQVVETYDAASLEDLESLIQLGKIEMS